jgi:hypothetical protein
LKRGVDYGNKTKNKGILGLEVYYPPVSIVLGVLQYWLLIL